MQAKVSLPMLRQALLFSLCVVWFVPGLVGRSLWNPTETYLVPAAAESFADGWSVVVTSLGEPLAGTPPLYLYVASMFGNLLSGFLPYHEGMRFSSVFWLVAALVLAGMVIGNRHGSRVGWRMVLLMMSSFGLLLHARTVNPDVMLVLLGVLGVLGISRMRHSEVEGGLLLGTTGALMAMFLGMVAVWYVLALLLLPMGKYRQGLPKPWRPGVVLAIVIVVLGLGTWMVLLEGVDPSLPVAFATHAASDLSLAKIASSLRKLISSASWITWPALPFAVMSLIKWRHGGKHGKEVPEGLIALAAGMVALSLVGNDRDSGAFLLLPAAAYMSVIGMQNLSREVAKIHDRFALFVIGGGMIGFFWMSWIAVSFGYPAGMVEWLSRLGVEKGVSGLPIVFSIAASIAWFTLILRIGRSSERAMVNWVAGITVSWLLFALMWMPEVDEVKGYGKMADSLSKALPSEYGCIAHEGVNKELLAQIAYLAKLEIAHGDAGRKCEWLLTHSDGSNGSNIVWSGKRKKDLPSKGLSLHRANPALPN